MRSRRPRGLTLIELMITIGVISVLFASVVYGVGALTGSRAKESSAQLAGMIRALYDTSALSGRTCRIVFTLPKERDDDSPVSYHAECAKGAVTASSKRDDELRDLDKADKKKREDDERLKRIDRDDAPSAEALMLREKQRVDQQAAFSNFGSDDIQERTLPSGVRVEVWTQKQKTPAKSGVAYLYFFPQGFTERAQVYVRQGKNTWTILVSPLTGKTSVVSEDVEVPRS